MLQSFLKFCGYVGLTAIIIALLFAGPILTGWLVCVMVGTPYHLAWSTWLAGLGFNMLIVGGSSRGKS